MLIRCTTCTLQVTHSSKVWYTVAELMITNKLCSRLKKGGSDQAFLPAAILMPHLEENQKWNLVFTKIRQVCQQSSYKYLSGEGVVCEKQITLS